MKVDLAELSSEELFGYLLAKAELTGGRLKATDYPSAKSLLDLGRLTQKGQWYLFTEVQRAEVKGVELPKSFLELFEKYIENSTHFGVGVRSKENFVKKLTKSFELNLVSGSDLVKYYLLCEAMLNENFSINLSGYPLISQQKLAKKLLDRDNLQGVINTIFEYTQKGGKRSIYDLYINYEDNRVKETIKDAW